MLFAVTQTPREKLQAIPVDVWLKLGFGVGLILVGALLLRLYAESKNKLVINGVLFAVILLTFSHWVFERGEPRFLTPVVDVVAQSGFFGARPDAPAAQGKAGTLKKKPTQTPRPEPR
jgi:type IV secretory pathway TrbD component